MAQGVTVDSSWFTRDDLIALWLADFLSAQLQQMRPNFTLPQPWQAQTVLNRAEADIDSIELVELASALYLALDAENSGVLDTLKLGRSFGSWSAFAQQAAARTQQYRFASSGSSGKPKWIAHQCVDLEREVRALAGHFQGVKRVVTLMPAHHLYGFLFGIVLPAQLGLHCVSLRGEAPASVRAHLLPGDLVVAFPGFWQHPPTRHFPNAVIGLSSGQTLAPDCFASLQAAGLQQLFEIYGSSETAGVGLRCAAGPFRLMERYRAAENGALWDQYQDCAVTPPDWLAFEPTDAQTFHLLGRRDRVVQVAGNNVALDGVEATLQRFPGVCAARVRLRSHGRLDAYLQCSDPPNLSELRRFCAEHLSAAATPVDFCFGPDLPRTPEGKERDWR